MPFRPAAVLSIEPDENATITDIVTPLLRVALAHRYPGGVYSESIFYQHLAAILERQELGPCAFDGVAFVYPDHDSKVRVDRAGIDEPIVVVGASTAGMQWLLLHPGKVATNEALDGQLVHAVFLILSGEDVGKDLKLKAAVARRARMRAIISM